MQKRLIIGLAGRKGSGKSTAAAHLVEYHNFVEYSFATPLKAGIGEMFGLSYAQLHDPVEKEVPDEFWGVTPRKLMQVVGTELFREALPKVLPELKLDGETIWIRRFRQWIDRMPANRDVVISDVRFSDEAAAIRSLGGQVWLVDRPSLDTTIDGHTSEQPLENYDCSLLNNRTLQHFRGYLDNMVWFEKRRHIHGRTHYDPNNISGRREGRTD